MSCKQRAPAHVEARHRLPDHLLGVLPDVLVAPLAVAEADHRRDLGQPRVERARHVQRIEAFLRVTPEQELVEVLAQRLDAHAAPIRPGVGRAAERRNASGSCVPTSVAQASACSAAGAFAEGAFEGASTVTLSNIPPGPRESRQPNRRRPRRANRRGFRPSMSVASRRRGRQKSAADHARALSCSADSFRCARGGRWYDHDAQQTFDASHLADPAVGAAGARRSACWRRRWASTLTAQHRWTRVLWLLVSSERCGGCQHARQRRRDRRRGARDRADGGGDHRGAGEQSLHASRHRAVRVRADQLLW